MDEPDYSDLSDRDILIGMLEYLAAIEHHLRPAQAGDEPMYQCKQCLKDVAESDRKRHAQEQHNAPAGIDVTGDFERVDA